MHDKPNQQHTEQTGDISVIPEFLLPYLELVSIKYLINHNVFIT